MATLYLTEYSGMASNTQIAQEPELNSQTLTIGSETKSTAFQTNTHIIRVEVDAICSIRVSGPDSSGNFVTATTSNKRMSAGDTEYWGVRPGDKLSVISNT